jgi:hypothetical protein
LSDRRSSDTPGRRLKQTLRKPGPGRRPGAELV